MKKLFFKWVPLFAAVLSVFVSSCSNDEWDKHYNNTDYELTDLNLAEYIKSQPGMSSFYRIMEITGYDSILSAPQSYTVWVPSNESLQNLDMNDTTSLIELVKNHIARFTIPTSGIISKKVYMLSGKLVLFTKINNEYTFGSILLTDKNVSAKNGIVHSISGYVPYAPNIWESLDRIAEIDSLRNYLNSKFTEDEELGSYNVILKALGAIDNEDSTYTALFPSNKAWRSSYNRIKDYYKVYYTPLNVAAAVAGERKKRELTNFSIIQDAIFSEVVTEPILFDSLISTYGNVFHNPSDLFIGATPITVSNGIVYLTDSMRHAATDSWFKEIRIEAENTLFGRKSTNASLYFRSSIGSGFEVSDNRFLTVEPITTSDLSQVTVTFPIPNTLSAKYNIYCVFVPELIVDASSHKPYIANFYLDYTNSAGKPITNQALATNLSTKSDEMTKLYVGQFTFPFCDILDSNSSISDISVRLKVANVVKTKQTTTNSRTMRIDCIIFEPVN